MASHRSGVAQLEIDALRASIQLAMQHQHVLQQQQQQQQDQQQPQQQDQQQQQQQQQQDHNEDHCPPGAAVTAAAVAAADGAVAPRPVWTLNKLGVPTMAMAPAGEGDVARDAVAPAGDGDDGREATDVDHEYEATSFGPCKWKRRHELLSRAVLERDIKRARTLARKMYAGPPLMGPV